MRINVLSDGAKVLELRSEIGPALLALSDSLDRMVTRAELLTPKFHSGDINDDELAELILFRLTLEGAMWTLGWGGGNE